MTGTVGLRLIAAAMAVVLLGACGRPAPTDEAQTSAAPDPAAESTTPTSATVDAAVPSDSSESDAMGDSTDAMSDDSGSTAAAGEEAAATVVTAPVLTADNVAGVVDPTPGMAGVKITSQGPIVAPTPTTAPPVVAENAPAGTGGVHIVQPGDTLSVIAETYGVTIQAIADANGLVDVDSLTAGDELQIPASG